MDFKVGDIVKIKTNLNRIDDFKCGYMPDMKKWEGEIVRIKGVEKDYVKIIEHPFNWDKRAFEPIYSKLTKQELLKMPLGTKITTDTGFILLRDDTEKCTTGIKFENGDFLIREENIAEDLTIKEIKWGLGSEIVKIETPIYSTVYRKDDETKEMTISEIEKMLGHKIKIKGE